MRIMAFYQPGFFREELASTSVEYKITKELNGMILVNNMPMTSGGTPIVVSTQNVSTLSVQLHDPTNFLKHAQLQYYWFLNDTNFGKYQQ